MSHLIDLGPVQTPYFTWAESNANEGEQRIFLICIRFGSCEVRRLNLALVYCIQSSSFETPTTFYFGNTFVYIKVKNDHRSKFSNLSNSKEEAWKNTRALTGFEPVTYAIPVRYSTNWDMKPHIGSEVNLLSSHLPWGVKWCEIYMK